MIILESNIWVGHIGCTGEIYKENITYYWENPDGRDHLGDGGITRRIIVKLILNQ
jgi:hypothetical protein